MPDPTHALTRRGAEWTFDAKKFTHSLLTCKSNGQGVFPSFDHSVGDPVEGDITVTPTHEYVIVEGLYLLLDTPPWNEIKDIVDVSIFVDAETAVLKSRLIKRHMQCFHMTEEEAKHRAEENDLPNAVDVIASKVRADIIFDNSIDSSAISILRIESQDWSLLKAVRLKALGDTPDAFGTPLSVEETQPDEFWKGRASNEKIATFVVVGASSVSALAPPGARVLDDCLGLITGAPAFHREGTSHGEKAAGLYSM